MKDKRTAAILLIIVLIPFALYVFYISIPQWLGFILEKETKAVIDSTDFKTNYPKRCLSISFVNTYLNKKISFQYCRNSNKLLSYKKNDTIVVKFYRYFPKDIAIVGINSSNFFNDCLLMLVFGLTVFSIIKGFKEIFASKNN